MTTTYTSITAAAFLASLPNPSVVWEAVAVGVMVSSGSPSMSPHSTQRDSAAGCTEVWKSHIRHGAALHASGVYFQNLSENYFVVVHSLCY